MDSRTDTLSEFITITVIWERLLWLNIRDLYLFEILINNQICQIN